MAENAKIRVLLGILGAKPSGRFHYMLNLFDQLDPQQFAITVLADVPHPFGEERILFGGGRVIPIPPRKKDPAAHRSALRSVLQSGNFDVCHIHLATASNVEVLQLAKSQGIPVVIAHSHSNQVEGGWLPKLLHAIGRRKLQKMELLRFACSQEAGQFLYGKASFTVIPNAIDLNRFSFDDAVRARVRAALHVGEAPVIGHVGRLVPVKNHEFSLRLLREARQITPGTRLLIVGDGPLREQIAQQAAEWDLQDAVIFTGNVEHPEDYYCAMDAMILPSHFEGFPLTVLEGLAVGLPVFLSEYVSKEVAFCDRVQVFPLDANLRQLWETILTAAHSARQPQTALLRARGFDAKMQIREMEQIYRSAKGE